MGWGSRGQEGLRPQEAQPADLWTETRLRLGLSRREPGIRSHTLQTLCGSFLRDPTQGHGKDCAQPTVTRLYRDLEYQAELQKLVPNDFYKYSNLPPVSLGVTRTCSFGNSR